jgi:hypothetical protein
MGGTKQRSSWVAPNNACSLWVAPSGYGFMGGTKQRLQTTWVAPNNACSLWVAPSGYANLQKRQPRKLYSSSWVAPNNAWVAPNNACSLWVAPSGGTKWREFDWLSGWVVYSGQSISDQRLDA